MLADARKPAHSEAHRLPQWLAVEVPPDVEVFLLGDGHGLGG